jgi:hypothetical protein
MGLSPSPSSDATCYVIYKKQGFSFLAIDTVCGNIPTLYINTSSNPNGASETYSIAAIDSCGNISTIGQSQNTLFLNQAYSLCDKSVLLGWNSYINMKGGKLWQQQVLPLASRFHLLILLAVPEILQCSLQISQRLKHTLGGSQLEI